jgi:hypothetical protein
MKNIIKGQEGAKNEKGIFLEDSRLLPYFLVNIYKK